MRKHFMAAIMLAVGTASAIAGGKGGGGHASASTHPQESVTLNYGKIEHSYQQQRVSGSKTGPARSGPKKATGRIANKRLGGQVPGGGGPTGSTSVLPK
jgi:hypothetical protein